MDITVTLYEKHDPAVHQAKEYVQAQAVLSWLVLFEGDRWLPVERVAIAFQDSTIVGLASLAPHGEGNAPQALPTIVGIWVHPDFRGRKRGDRSIGLDLIAACVKEAQDRYGASQIIIEGVSPDGLRLAKKALAQGYPLRVSGAGMVPLP